ncbi:uncharacterized protein BX663DRAFT_576355 [Cokeromyces recurvatus]|uniref:uncharacterized protein n=1 Tax=Cokeromyces recurvatus TaxID=90255 RepID=UPI00221EB516|nr:uncharacterized protein BX663DRAFT_576355 [Cokeromyces recurvatus]KAI7899866.1 hypothetical protein BX663DRAFT_576355 [Cokeromyces recurvatus]
MKKPPPKKQRGPKTQTSKTAKSKKKRKKGKLGKGLTIEYVGVEERTAVENNKSGAKGTTTAHFVKFRMSVLISWT